MPFDPTDGLFVAMASRPSQLRDLDARLLSPFLRALLTIDGTVTQFIESFTGERVLIRLLDQSPQTVGEAADWLDCASATPCLLRRSLLEGQASGRLYAFAESLIIPERLPPGMRDSLESEPGGLGKILVNSGLETRREGLWFGCEELADVPPALAGRAGGHFLTRCYRVLAHGAPLMQITERVPLDEAAS